MSRPDPLHHGRIVARAGNLLCVPQPARSVALVTLGCARNEVDSEELAGRLGAGGWALIAEPDDADVVLVNTCGFIDSAKKDSIDTLLAAADTGKKVVAVGCLAERYGDRARRRRCPRRDAVARLRLLRRHRRTSRRRRGRARRSPRTCRAIGARCCRSSPVQRPAAAAEVALPGHAWLPSRHAAHPPRRRPGRLPEAGLGLRPALHVLRDPVLPRLVRLPAAGRRARRGAVAGRRPVRASSCSSARTRRPTARTSATCARSRRCCRDSPPSTASTGSGSSYLQPAELRPGLLEAIAAHARASRRTSTCRSSTRAQPVLRRMKRFGGTDAFLELLARARELAPDARRAQQRHRRLPRRDRGRRRRARAVPRRGAARRRSACSATPTRTAPTRSTFDGKLDRGRDRRAGRADQRAGRRTRQRSAPRTGSGRGSTCSSRTSTRTA